MCVGNHLKCSALLVNAAFILLKVGPSCTFLRNFVKLCSKREKTDLFCQNCEAQENLVFAMYGIDPLFLFSNLLIECPSIFVKWFQRLILVTSHAFVIFESDYKIDEHELLNVVTYVQAADTFCKP